MSDEQLDELAEAARNRGLKLVRSRVRTANKRRFGKVGLTDKGGKPVFGMDSKGPVAKPEDVEHFLRNLGAKDWGASLDVAVLPRKRKAKASREPANDREPGPKPEPGKKTKPEPKPKPKPPPEPKIRDAKPADAERLAELIRYLGHEIDEKAVRRNLKALKKSDETPLVATLDKQIIGLCGVSARPVIHRGAPIGRISPLVVAEEAQGHGIGRMLVETAEQWMRKRGCKLVEVTSNDRRTAAHSFYRHMGYERTSIRFAKQLNK
jgi:GNAT superfamily N-acetyltransferase